MAINTHIDCANNSKWSVREILRATKQGALESVLVHFLLDLMDFLDSWIIEVVLHKIFIKRCRLI